VKSVKISIISGNCCLKGPIPFSLLGFDPFEVDFQKLTSHRGPNPDAVKEDVLVPVVGPNTDEIAGELGEECG
jgi:hypothetical protein